MGLQKFAGTYRHILTGQVILMSRILIERFYCSNSATYGRNTAVIQPYIPYCNVLYSYGVSFLYSVLEYGGGVNGLILRPYLQP
jgi:hypothetical protein